MDKSQPPALPIDTDAQQAADAQHYRAMLHEMIDIGMRMARRLDQQAAASDEAVADASAALERVGRFVRRTVLTAQRVAQPLPARAVSPASRRTAVRKQIIRAVEDAIQLHAGDDEQAKGAYAEFRERLDSPELDEEIADRPAAELILEIVRDLEALPSSHLWKRRTPQDVEALCALAAAAPGTPACELPYVPPPLARGGAFGHPDDLLDPKVMTDAQLDAAIEREDERDRFNSAKLREEQRLNSG